MENIMCGIIIHFILYNFTFYYNTIDFKFE